MIFLAEATEKVNDKHHFNSIIKINQVLINRQSKSSINRLREHIIARDDYHVVIKRCFCLIINLDYQFTKN